MSEEVMFAGTAEAARAFMADDWDTPGWVERSRAAKKYLREQAPCLLRLAEGKEVLHVFRSERTCLVRGHYSADQGVEVKVAHLHVGGYSNPCESYVLGPDSPSRTLWANRLRLILTEDDAEALGLGERTPGVRTDPPEVRAAFGSNAQVL